MELYINMVQTDKTKKGFIKEIKLLKKLVEELKIFYDKQKRQQKKDLKNILDQNQSVLDNIPDIVWLKDEKSRYIMVNKAFASTCGFKIKEIIGKTDLDIWPIEFAEKYRRDDSEVIKSKKTKRIKQFLANKEGEIQWLEKIKVPIFNKKGNVIKVIGSAHNVTKLRNIKEEFKKTKLELYKDKLLLKQKNLALKELIEYMERAKNEAKEDIAVNIENFILPILNKLKMKSISPKYLKLLEDHLKEIVSTFGSRIIKGALKLSLREIEICDMIKSGLASKEISELLNVSSQTIEKHRRNIRKKLGIANKKINLASYLQKI